MPEILIADKPTLDLVKQDTASILSSLGVGKPILLGFRINKYDSNPATRIEYLFDAKGRKPAKMIFNVGFDYGDWADEWFIKNLKIGMVNFTGNWDYDINPDDYSKRLDNGAASQNNSMSYNGNVMAAIPLVWLYQYEDKNYEYCLISNVKYNENFKAWAHRKASDVIMDYRYLACYKGSKVTSGNVPGTAPKLRSLSNQQPTYNNDASAEVTMARENGSLWYIQSWSERNLINSLLQLMGRSDDSQTTFGKGNLNYQSTLAPTYGVMKTGALDKSGLFYGYDDTTHQVKVFGMEGWWGDQWSRLAGCINDNGHVKINPSQPYTFMGGMNYRDVGVVPSGTSGGYIKTTKMTPYGRVPVEASGSDSTYLCDGLWFNNSINAYALAGGDCAAGLLCGFSCLALNDPSGDAYWSLGACLSCEQPT